MRQYLPSALALISLLVFGSTALAEEKAPNESGQLSIEKVIEDCEKQYSEQMYPDPDERNKLIDQCIDDNSVDQPPASAE